MLELLPPILILVKQVTKSTLYNKKAFTLIEVMIATAILAMGILTLQSSWSGSIRSVTKSKEVQTAALLLKNKMTELDVKYRENMGQLPEEDSGPFEGYPNYSWSMKSVAFVPPDFTALLLEQGGQADALLDIMKRMQGIFKKNVKEMQVTVVFKKDEITRTYTVTTLMVDFDTPIDFTGGL